MGLLQVVKPVVHRCLKYGREEGRAAARRGRRRRQDEGQCYGTVPLLALGFLFQATSAPHCPSAPPEIRYPTPSPQRWIPSIPATGLLPRCFRTLKQTSNSPGMATQTLSVVHFLCFPVLYTPRKNGHLSFQEGTKNSKKLLHKLL